MSDAATPAGRTLAELFGAIGPQLEVIAIPHGPRHPGRHTIAIGLFTTYNEQATTALARVIADHLTEALAAEGVNWFGLPIHVTVAEAREEPRVGDPGE